MDNKLISGQAAQNIINMQSPATYRPNLERLMWGYKNDAQAWVADMIAPWFPVPDVTGQYRYLDSDAFFNKPDTALQGSRGYANESSWGDNLQNYTLANRAHAVYLKNIDRDRAISQYGSVERWRQISVEFLASKMRLDRENTVLSFFVNSSNYANNTTLVGNNQWSALTTSTPRNDVLTAHAAIDKYGVHANTLIMGPDVYYTLLKHPDLGAKVTGGANKKGASTPESAVGLVNIDVMREYFDVQNIVVARAVYNSTPEQSSATLSYLMNDSVALVYVDQMAGGNDLMPTFCKTLVFQPQANAASGGWRVKSVMDERADGGAGGEYLTAWYYSDVVSISNGLGYLIQDTLA